MRPPYALLSAVAVAASLAGCNHESVRLVNSWDNPKLEGRGYRKVLVVAAPARSDIRRNIEDAFVRELGRYGCDGVPSYQYLPEEKKVSDAKLKEAVDQSGAEALLFSRIAEVENRTEVTPGYWGPYGYGPYAYGAWGYYGYYGWAWGPYYDPPRVYQYRVVTLENRLVDAKDAQLAWSGATRTVDPESLWQESQDLARVVTYELARRGYVGDRKPEQR